MKAKNKWAEEWCLRHSSPGDFEEYGQAEAWHAGFNLALEKASKMIAGLGNDGLALLVSNIGNSTNSEPETK
jgi:hypothetical protein